jgi:hypothetical protein
LEVLHAEPALMLVADNDTRWNSTYDMIWAAVKQRERIDAFVAKTLKLEEDALSEQDWQDLKDMLALLEPFKEVTMIGQEKGSRYGSIASTLWAFDILLESLEKAKERIKSTENTFRKAIERAWSLLDKYYHLTDQSTVHIFAMMLDPWMKLEYFERKWPREWVDDAKVKIHQFYNQYTISNQDTSDKTPSTETVKKSDDTAINNLGPGRLDIDSWLFGDIDNVDKDELEEYLKAGKLKFTTKAELKQFDIHAWWVGNETVYPTLAAIYFDLCSVPSMSVEPERVFSGFTFITALSKV